MRGSRMRHMPHPPRDHPATAPAAARSRAASCELLAERPMHGYELIGELEERTGGRWRPSPGSVYPTLAQLEDEGLVRSFDDDGRKRFELTDAGRTWLDEHAGRRATPRRGSAAASAAGATCAGSAARSSASCASSAASARRPSRSGPGRSSPAPAPSSTPCWPNPPDENESRRPCHSEPGPRTPATSPTPDPGSVGRSRRDRGVERAPAGRLRERITPSSTGPLRNILRSRL